MTFSTRLTQVRARIAAAAAAAGRAGAQVRIVAATKQRSLPEIAAAVDAGIEIIAENRAQELVAKADGIGALTPAPAVHFIGRVQRNKLNLLGARVHCIHSVDSLPLATAIAARCPNMQVLIQVNTAGAVQQGGADPRDVPQLARQIGALGQLELIGLMTIGSRTDPGASFSLLRDLRDEVVSSGAAGTAHAHELSMGMSGDFEIAVAHGATLVRLGSVLFGPR